MKGSTETTAGGADTTAAPDTTASARAPALPAPAVTQVAAIEAQVSGGPALQQTVSGANALEAAERGAILKAVENNQWNMTMTARDLGMSRNTLYRKLKRHNIPLGDARRDDLSRM